MKKATITLKNKIPKDYSGMTPEEVLETNVQISLRGVFNMQEAEVLIALIKSWNSLSSNVMVHRRVEK